MAADEGQIKADENQGNPDLQQGKPDAELTRPEESAACLFCVNHPRVEAAGRCLSCSRLLCRACIRLNEDGIIYCPEHEVGSEAVCTVSEGIPYDTKDLADFGTRAVAYILDGIILAFLVSMVFRIFFVFNVMEDSYISYFFKMNLMFALVLCIYCTILVGTRGQTIGHAALGIKVVGEKGESVGFWRAFLRWVGYLLCTLSLFAGFLVILRDPHRQGWHDKFAHTVVTGASLTLREKVAWSAGLAVFGTPVLIFVFLQVYAPY